VLYEDHISPLKHGDAITLSFPRKNAELKEMFGMKLFC